MTFLRQRLSWSSPTGLPLTIIVLAVCYFAILYVTHALDPTRQGPVVRLDLALSNMMSGFRTPAVVRLFSVITAFGYWGVVIVMAIAISALLWLGGRAIYIFPLWVALAGNQVTANLVKLVFARARPELAYYRETTYSFPSGHSAAGAAFFGVLAYILVRARLAPAGLAVAGSLLCILAIGMSRLILGEHYLSDVLNGYLVGGIWVFLAIWLMERRPVAAISPAPRQTWQRVASVAVLLVALAVVWVLVARYISILVVFPHPPIAS